MTEVRLFVADRCDGGWSELTDGVQCTVRVAASDLQQARRARARIRARGEDVAVILDVTVAVAGDFRSGAFSGWPITPCTTRARSTGWQV